MQMRDLGANGFPVSEIGLGCWQFGGDFGPMEEATAMEIMETAVENGIRFFDTANVYGDGRSEKLIGRFLRECSVPLRVATKYGRGSVYPDGYSLDSLRQAIHDARERMGVDCLDLLQLHCVPTETLQQGEIFDWLRTVQEEGLIQHFGASVESDEQALICLQQPGLLSLQMIFNLFRQKPITTVFSKAREQGVGIIVRLPLASGLLAGKYASETQFPESDHRNYNRDGAHFNVGETFAGIPFETGIELVETMRDWTPEGWTMAQMAQRWILDQPAVSTVITGASTKAQVVANASASDLPRLDDTLHTTLREHYENHVKQHIRGPY